MIGKGVLHYRSWQLSSHDDVGLMFACYAQFSKIRIIELFVILEDSHLSFGGFVLNPTHVPMSQLVHSQTFAMASHVQNENTYNENADDLMGGPSFHQLTM